MSIFHLHESSNSWVFPLIGSLSGAFLSGIIAILIFVLGKYLEKKKERRKELGRVRDIENLIGVQIRAIQAPLAQQVSSICHFLRSIKTDIEQSLELKIVASYTPSELLFTKKDELYKVLVHERDGDLKAKHEYFFDYRNNMLFLANSKSAIKIWATEFNEKYQKYVYQYKDHLEKVVRTLDILGIEAEARRVKIGEDKFLEATDKIISNLQSIDNFQDIHVIHKHFLLPLHKICKDKSIVYADVRVNLILSDIMAAMFNFDNYEYTRHAYYELLLDLVRKIRKSNQLLLKSYSALIKNKIKT